MTTGPAPACSRALVLGGGGVTGIAWQVGVLAGLRAAGVDLSDADAVFGTSAGAFVGAALAAGRDLEQLFAAQFEPDQGELPAAASEEVMAAWYAAFVAGGTDRQQVGAAMGRIGKAHPEPVPLAARRGVVAARLGACWLVGCAAGDRDRRRHWGPARLRCLLGGSARRRYGGQRRRPRRVAA